MFQQKNAGFNVICNPNITKLMLQVRRNIDLYIYMNLLQRQSSFVVLWVTLSNSHTASGTFPLPPSTLPNPILPNSTARNTIITEVMMVVKICATILSGYEHFQSTQAKFQTNPQPTCHEMLVCCINNI